MGSSLFGGLAGAWAGAEQQARDLADRDRATAEHTEDRAWQKDQRMRQSMHDQLTDFLSQANFQRSGLTTNSTADDGTPLPHVGAMNGKDYYYDHSADPTYIRARSQAQSSQALDDWRRSREEATRPMTDDEAADAQDALIAKGVDPTIARAALSLARSGNRVPLNNMLKPPTAPRVSTRDPNIAPAAKTQTAINENDKQIAATTKAMPKFPQFSVAPQSDSAAVIAGRTPLLNKMGDLTVRGDSLSQAYDKHASAIGTGQAASGEVDVTGLRQQMEEGRRKLNAILSNPNAPLAVKARAQSAYQSMLQQLGQPPAPNPLQPSTSPDDNDQ